MGSGLESCLRHGIAGLATLVAVGCGPAPEEPPQTLDDAGLPIWGETFSRHPGNPVLWGPEISPDHVFAADPRLFVLGDRLHLIYEAFAQSPYLGEIWLAESRDAIHWSTPSRVSLEAVHFSHPEVRIVGDTVHAFYNANDRGRIFHRASPVEGFPSWGEETVVFVGVDHGWDRLTDFTFLEQEGLWYLLGITGDGESADRWIRGRVSPDLTASWDRSVRLGSFSVPHMQEWRGVGSVLRLLGVECLPCFFSRHLAEPLVDVSEVPWLDTIVELTAVEAEGRQILLMGARINGLPERAIAAYEVTQLSPSSLSGRWLAEGFTFPPASGSGWDSQDIHRGHTIVFGDRWVMAYDGNLPDECEEPSRGCWRIGIATRPLR